MEYQIAIVEDNKETSDDLKNKLQLFEKEENLSFCVSQFSDGLSFMNSFHSQFDLVFLDIEMPYMNGMEVAKRMREYDEKVLIVFVTNLAQFAVDGYQVNAFDFIIKPVTYANFKMKLKRIQNQLEHQSSDSFVMIQTRNFAKKVKISHIFYLEVRNHDVIIHLEEEDLEIRSTLNSWEEKLPKQSFVRCNSYTLVNLAYVDDIQGEELTVNGKKIRISRGKRTRFLNSFGQYIGGSK